ncbi:MAG TPA: hypothetical protein PLQ88_34110, partial [Blastocatellia bacterium]|nr:hypothetical protein [Blastocatellia bacterium]
MTTNFQIIDAWVQPAQREAFEKLPEVTAPNVMATIAEGDELRVMLVALRRLTKQDPINTAALRERLS